MCETIGRTRPTAVDLFWAIDRFKQRFDVTRSAGRQQTRSQAGLARIKTSLVEEAQDSCIRNAGDADESIGRFGAELSAAKSGRVMTQCNAGALATGGIGTALGVIRMAIEGRARASKCWCRKRGLYLQGARA